VSVDAGVPDPAREILPGICGHDHFACEAALEVGEAIVVERGTGTAR
jgi:hypothetical protein